MARERVTIAGHGLGNAGEDALFLDRALARKTSVTRAYVNPGLELAYVEYDPAVTSLARVLRAAEDSSLRAGELAKL